MQIHLFRGTGRVFGFTESAGGDNLPPRYGPWAAFKSVEMTRDEPMPGVQVNECLDDIAAHGFHLTDAHTRITQLATG